MLGLVAAQPARAGDVAAIIAELKRIGGETSAFAGAATLTDAHSNVIIEKPTRGHVVSVRHSVAEAGSNSRSKDCEPQALNARSVRDQVRTRTVNRTVQKMA
jgi:hypothetical protein